MQPKPWRKTIGVITMFTTFKLVLLPDFNPALTTENGGGGVEKCWAQWRTGGGGQGVKLIQAILTNQHTVSEAIPTHAIKCD